MSLSFRVVGEINSIQVMVARFVEEHTIAWQQSKSIDIGTQLVFVQNDVTFGGFYYFRTCKNIANLLNFFELFWEQFSIFLPRPNFSPNPPISRRTNVEEWNEGGHLFSDYYLQKSSTISVKTLERLVTTSDEDILTAIAARELNTFWNVRMKRLREIASDYLYKACIYRTLSSISTEQVEKDIDDAVRDGVLEVLEAKEIKRTLLGKQV